ncbi:MAG: YdcF family protein [Clostridia bacterium]|nr:YdcF family protein [Clostridia bacterium]
MQKILCSMFSSKGRWLTIPFFVGLFSFLLQGSVYGLRFVLQLTALACGCWIVFYLSLLLRTHEDKRVRIPAKILMYSMITGVILLFLLFVFVEGLILYHQDGDAIPEDVQVIFVLGCQVEGETPCEMLRYRLEAAYGFLRDRPESIAVLCGGQGDGEDITEAECMRRWLAERGISQDRLYLEDSSVNTRENINNATEILNDIRPGTERVAVATTGFHVFRAKILCENAGFDAYGVSGAMPSSLVVIVNSYLREFAGVFFMYVRQIFA